MVAFREFVFKITWKALKEFQEIANKILETIRTRSSHLLNFNFKEWMVLLLNRFKVIYSYQSPIYSSSKIQDLEIL